MPVFSQEYRHFFILIDTFFYIIESTSGKGRMSTKEIFAGIQKLSVNNPTVSGKLIPMNDEMFYKISHYDRMNPFLVSIVSASDHWLYISSTGGLTAGRRNPDNSLFPYVTDDKLYLSSEITGSKTILKIVKADKIVLWEPFSEKFQGVYDIQRNLYKNIYGTKIIFEEINNDLGLTFTYSWTTSDKYGFVRQARLINTSGEEITVELLDGIQNLLPSGVDQQMQNEYSTLVDGYKRNEIIANTSLALYTLSSIPSDGTQPSESLAASSVFNLGIKANTILLSSLQLGNFRTNSPLRQENLMRGNRGAYFINANFTLKPDEKKEWHIIAEVNQNADDIVGLIEALQQNDFVSLVQEDIKESQTNLVTFVAEADGFQLSGDKLSASRHFSNTLFNIMRGGVFDNSYLVDKHDFLRFIKKANPFVFKAHYKWLQSLPDTILHSDLVSQVEQQNDPHFTRLALEYLPLTFSRRHGDPSRPWNRFSIEIKNDNGEKILNYQGNWRDVFQNWEALAYSYPKFLESMISKFLNASTADGYNPYRIFRDGFEWEAPEPHDPWANIGYWGDHQIIYLLKLLELSKEFNPHSLEKFLIQNIFSFANVPYRIKEYNKILKDPRNSIEFDAELHRQLKADAALYGSDSKFLKKPDNTLVQVNLMEKLLITLLVKLSNFIPGGGIWMNTQRPEWNDANNALAGYGVSMVTLFYIRRYLLFLKSFIHDTAHISFNLSNDVIDFLSELSSAIERLNEIGNESISDAFRKEIVDQLGIAGSDYRLKIYRQGFNPERSEVSADTIIEFADSCLKTLDRTIALNKREDGLYHSFNVLHISSTEMAVTHLYEMLEGQVAVLSSGYLTAQDAIALLTALKKSRLYREDQNSYLLYPDKQLPLFLEKNIIPAELVSDSGLLKSLLESGNKAIVYKDVKGGIHFQSDIVNSAELKKKMDALGDSLEKEFSPDDLAEVMNIYEKTFNHSAFTGRATTFFKYEGLGSIYWHMVSKLLLAVQEVYFNAKKNSAEESQLSALKKFYYDIQEGIGTHKSPSLYGAFPTDAYSHTPSFTGAQQPGLTGQVKEDIISRFREIGIIIHQGKLSFDISLFRKEEVLNEKEIFHYYDVHNQKQSIECGKNSFAFTYCQIPFIYKFAENRKIIISMDDDKQRVINSLSVDEKLSQSIFNREGKIIQVEVFFDNKIFL